MKQVRDELAILEENVTEALQYNRISRPQMANYKAKFKAMDEAYLHCQDGITKTSDIRHRELRLVEELIELCEFLIKEIDKMPNGNKKSILFKQLEVVQSKAFLQLNQSSQAQINKI